MRIISGILGGRVFTAPTGSETRPTHDRVREAVFSMIGPYFNGGRALDLFAGSGAMGLEAVSRGIDHCVFCDHSRAASRVVSENLRKLGILSKATVLQSDWEKCLSSQKEAFDIVFLDPPYDLHLLPAVLKKLSELWLIQPGAKIVCEMKAGDTLEYDENVYHLDTLRKYGLAQIAVLTVRN